MDQIEFFDAVKSKKMKEATITLECGCQILYSPLTKEVFVKPCSIHSEEV